MKYLKKKVLTISILLPDSPIKSAHWLRGPVEILSLFEKNLIEVLVNYVYELIIY